MSNFDRKLKEAQSKHRRIYVSISITLGALALLVASIMVGANGTSVTVHPEDASATATIEVIDGFGIAIGDSIYALGNEPEILVSAIGYKPDKRKISFQEKGRSVEVTLSPLPGKIVITTLPKNDDTRWSINLNAVAIAAALEQEIEAGEYEVGISHPYFETENRKISVLRGEETHLNVDLKRIRGTIFIETSPIRAEVRVDDILQPIVPEKLSVEGGVHDVVVTHPDFITLTDTISITNIKREVSRTYKLKRKPSTLSFNLSPHGGSLVLDGKKIDASAPISVSSKVKHQITYHKAGYFSQSQTVTLPPSQAQSVTIRLKPEMGILEVSSKPVASVFVNNKNVGQTDLVLKLLAVPHKISIRKSGFRSVEKRILPNSKTPTLISVKLQTELAARLANAPRTYTNEAGLSFKLFEPGTFRMGAPRSEVGQRANEFIRNIKLEKPFYAGLHEVTEEQYAKFKGRAATGRFPVTSISWLDAVAFCNWLSKKEGLIPFYVIRGDRLASINKTSDGYRLLSEAEWEWLARSAGRNKQTVFPWGDDSVVPPMAANIADKNAEGLVDFFVPNYNDGHAKVAPVASFDKEQSGAFDLAGNVSEWVHDFYSLIPPDSAVLEVDPLGPNYGDSHVIKGANWRSGTRTELRAAYRDGLMAGRDDVGFRVGRYLYGGAK